MPELPEVEAITSVVTRHCVGQFVDSVEVLRGEDYVGATALGGSEIFGVYRRGKFVVFDLGIGYVLAHNAMTGFFDYEDEPWTFDYVEGRRTSSESDVRVKIGLSNGKVLRFHDTRLFGSIRWSPTLPELGPDLVATKFLMPLSPVIDEKQFRDGLAGSKHAIKQLLLDQSFVAGVGNIYSSEALVVAGIDPETPANKVDDPEILLEALVGVVGESIPTVRYDWLNVYRRSTCGLCGSPVERFKLKGRATFRCKRCQ